MSFLLAPYICNSLSGLQCLDLSSFGPKLGSREKKKIFSFTIVIWKTGPSCRTRWCVYDTLEPKDSG